MKLTISFLFFLLLLSKQALCQQSDFFEVDFSKADSVALAYPGYDLNKMSILSHLLTKDLNTEVEKFRAIYRWVCDNIGYDYETFSRNQEKRRKLRGEELIQWNKKVNDIVFENLVKRRATVCVGYAYLVKELANLSGIKCEIVDGYGRTANANVRGPGVANHSWNVVMLNEKWYVCDATWSSGLFDVRQNFFVKNFEPGYFLADPHLFIRTHYPLDTSWTLLQRNPSITEFLTAPLVYRTAYHYNLRGLIPLDFDFSAKKGSSVTFSFEADKSLFQDNAAFSLYVERGGETHTFQKTPREMNGIASVDHVFTAKGSYVVHLAIDDQVLFTYAVRIQ